MRRKLLEIGLVLLLIGFGFLFFGALLWPDESEILIGIDLYWLFYPLTKFTFAAFQSGHIPLWNPNLFLGFPQYAETQFSTFYPLMWLFSSWSVAQTAVWLYAFHLGLAAAGGYVLVRQLGGRWAGALIGGLTLGFNAFMITHIYAGHLPHLMTIAYLPWLLAAAHWAVQKRSMLPKIAATMVAAVPLALAMLAGYAPFFPFLVGAVTIYLFWLAVLAWQDNGWRDAGWVLLQWIGLGVFSGMLAAIQLLPTLQFAQLSSRVAGTNYAFANQNPMPITQLLTLVAPNLFGVPARYPLSTYQATYWAQTENVTYWESAIYVGVLPLLLWGLSWFLGKRRWLFWGVLGVVGLLLALGAEGGLHRVMYELVPGFGLFRVPARFGYFFVLSTAVLTGLMFDRWFDLPGETLALWREHLKKLLVWSVAIVGGLALFGVLIQAFQTDANSQLRVQGVVSQLVRFGFLLVLSVGLLLGGNGRPRWLLVVGAVIILLVDLWGSSDKLLQTTDIDYNTIWAQADPLLPDGRDTYRVISSGLQMNMASLYGFQHVAGYDDFRTETGVKLEELALNDARIAQMLSVRYHLFEPEREISPVLGEGWRYFTEGDTVTIFEQVDAQPRAFMVHDVVGVANEVDALAMISQPDIDFRETAVVQTQPNTHCAIEAGNTAASQVEITSYQPERVVIQVETDAEGWLVLTDLYYPGWRATLNGRSVPIQTTNYALRGVCVPAGAHEIIFTFEPPLLRIGIVISLVSWALVFGAILIIFLDAKKKRAQ